MKNLSEWTHKEQIEKIAGIVDPDCPDTGAYVDGHCCIIEAVQSVIDSTWGYLNKIDKNECSSDVWNLVVNAKKSLTS